MNELVNKEADEEVAAFRSSSILQVSAGVGTSDVLYKEHLDETYESFAGPVAHVNVTG